MGSSEGLSEWDHQNGIIRRIRGRSMGNVGQPCCYGARMTLSKRLVLTVDIERVLVSMNDAKYIN